MIEKISVKNIVEFRRKSDKSRITYISSLKKTKKEIQSEGGGDYWIISSSTIGNYFKQNKKELILEKIEEVIERRGQTKAKIAKDMYQRNIAILTSFEDFDFSNFRPNAALTYLSKPKDKSIIKIKGVPLQVQPNYVFSFKKNDVDKIGAVWFIIKLKGFEVNETALFTDALYRYLKLNHKKFEIDPDYCIALDLVSQKNVKYTQIQNKKIHSELDSTLEKIKKLL